MPVDTYKSRSNGVKPQAEQPFDGGYADPNLHDNVPGYDGRLLRGERTKRHIAEAMIDLIEEGNPKPTARLIAERAGVSLRLVFHHFEDIEAVFQVAAKIQGRRHWKKVVTIPSSGPATKRIEAVARQRRQLYVAITPVRQVVALWVTDHQNIQTLLADGRRHLRIELSTTFEPELTAAGDEAAILLDSVELASSWESWNSLREQGNRSAAAAQRTMEYTLTALLT